MSAPADAPAQLLPQVVLDRVAEFKSEHARGRYLGYYDIAQFLTGIPAFRAILEEHEDWFLHRASVPHRRENRRARRYRARYEFARR